MNINALMSNLDNVLADAEGRSAPQAVAKKKEEKPSSPTTQPKQPQNGAAVNEDDHKYTEADVKELTALGQAFVKKAESLGLSFLVVANFMDNNNQQNAMIGYHINQQRCSPAVGKTIMLVDPVYAIGCMSGGQGRKVILEQTGEKDLVSLH
jgi:hypothetical protein